MILPAPEGYYVELPLDPGPAGRRMRWGPYATRVLAATVEARNLGVLAEQWRGARARRRPARAAQPRLLEDG